MNYLDVYWARTNHLGETIQEKIKNSGIRSFEKWADESPFTISNLSVERGLYFRGVIIRSKDKEYEKIMFLHVANDIPIKVGDILNWPLDNGDIEKWILVQEEKKVNGTYRTFWIVRCNYLMKWIDAEGHLQQSWSYFVSSLDSKIKGNFRTWNNLITPQPNKYAELLMPRWPITRSTNFIVEDESWNVVEYDHTSVPGIIYLSLTENKINTIYDDTDNNIADLDKRAKYQIITSPTVQRFSIGDEITGLVYTVMKNGIPFTPKEVIYTTTDKSVVRKKDGKLVAVGAGTVQLEVTIPECTDIEPETLFVTVEVSEESTDISYYIDGPDTIRLDREAKYFIRSNNGETIAATNFSISDESYATVRYIEEDNTYIVKANKKNLLGVINFSVEINGEIINKEISIIPLW